MSELAVGDQIAVGYYLILPQCFPFPQPPPFVSLVVDAKNEVGELDEKNNSMGIPMMFFPTQVPTKQVPKAKIQ